MESLVNRAKVLVIRRPDFWIGAALCTAAFVLYARTMPPTVLDGDSGESQYIAYILGVLHSSGYPLYVLLGKLFTLIPLGDVAFCVNLLSVVCAALTAPFVYAVLLRLIQRRVPSILATLIFVVMPSVWGGALEAKTYALHLLLGVLCVWLALRWHQDGNLRDFYTLAFAFGLGLTNHHIIVFIAPAFAIVLWFNRARLSWGVLVRAALLALMPLALYAFIPIRAQYFISQQTPENWALYTREDAMVKGTVSAYYRHDLGGFLNLITGFDNSYKIKSPLGDDRVQLVVTLLLQQFGFVGIVLVLLGAIESFRCDRKHFAIVFLVALGVGTIATVLRGISAMFYFSLMYFAFALWIGFALDWLMQFAGRIRRVLPVFVALVVLLWPISTVITNYARLDESNNYAPRDYAQAVLRDDLAQNAVVIAPWEVSQPIRYFQFVENQRQDLLVVMITPLSRQFETMIANAFKLQRPFYLVQFDPEDRLATGPRTVQAIPLPLLQAPNPRSLLRDAKIIPEAQVLGFDLDPDPPTPGQSARMLIYYRALDRMYPMYSAQLTVSDITGKIWSETASIPGSTYFPTYRWWQLGEYYRDSMSINLPAAAPAGLYTLDLSWFPYDLVTRKADDNHEFKVSLGTIRVGDLAATDIQNPASTRIGDAITFLGWNRSAATLTRGQSFDVDLFWRTAASLNESYTVFVHLVAADGRVIADADSPPSRGLYPTDRWPVGDGIRDRHTLAIPADLAPGNYAIEAGMYLPATGARLSVGTADKIVLTQVSVR